MTAFAARYFDGRSSAGHAVQVSVDGAGRVSIRGDGVTRSFPRTEVRVSARLGSSPRYLYLPDGARCETEDHAAVDSALAADGGGLLHALERHWGTALAAALFTGAFLWASFQYGLPLVARHAAQAVPPAMEADLGRQAMDVLDRRMLTPTALDPDEQARVRAVFDRVTAGADVGQPVRLELRGADALGANALALPSGIVVLTDEMVALAGNDEELMSVIAHELGHVRGRHIMRSILQNSAAALLVATLLGDVTSITGLAASVPTFLVEQHYSRAFEFEADAYALDWMRANGVDASHFAAILQRLAAQHGGDGGATRYLSTHPSIGERVQAIEGG